MVSPVQNVGPNARVKPGLGAAGSTVIVTELLSLVQTRPLNDDFVSLRKLVVSEIIEEGEKVSWVPNGAKTSTHPDPAWLCH